MLMVRVEKAAGTSFDGVFLIERLHLLPDHVTRSNLTSALPQPALLRAWHWCAMTLDWVSITNYVMLSQFPFGMMGV